MVGNLRTRLLALHVLEAVLPACESGVEDDQMAQVFTFCYKLFHLFLQKISLELQMLHRFAQNPNQMRLIVDICLSRSSKYFDIYTYEAK